MSVAVGTLNIALGLVYLTIGYLVTVDMVRGRRMGWSHFGAAIVALAFTCGPIHLIHGVHVAFEGRYAGVLDLVTVMVGVPAGAAWALLRVEAMRGGRGDRFIAGSPIWIVAIPPLIGAYVTAVVATMLQRSLSSIQDPALIGPNLVLVLLYAVIAYFLARTQIKNRRPLGGWSVSGLALAGLFLTCSVMHLVYGYYGLAGAYEFDVHGAVGYWLAIPAGFYFLWVVNALYRGTFHDWNGAPAEPPSIVVDRSAPAGAMGVGS